MRRLPAGLLASLAISAVVAVASSIQTVHDPAGDASGPQNPDVIKATARTVGNKQVIVFTTRRSFRLFEAPALFIQQPGSRHPWQIGGQSHGQFLGGGPGTTSPRATVTQPSSRTIRYSFRPKDLKLKRSYKWYGSTGVVGHLDKIPDKGWTTTRIG